MGSPYRLFFIFFYWRSQFHSYKESARLWLSSFLEWRADGIKVMRHDVPSDSKN